MNGASRHRQSGVRVHFICAPESWQGCKYSKENPLCLQHYWLHSGRSTLWGVMDTYVASVCTE